MAERKRLTFVYRYHSDWIGGTYYVVNLIRALNLLPDCEKPFITIATDEISKFDKTIYPYLDFTRISFVLPLYKRIINKLTYYILNFNFFKIDLDSIKTTNIYPLTPEYKLNNGQNGIYWIPDFQEFYLPEMFSNREIKARKISHNYIVKNGRPVVFSSETARKDFNHFFPSNNNSQHVLRFVSFIDMDFRSINLRTLLEKYSINRPFFIVPNQFWKHKNHVVVLQAIKHLTKQQESTFQVVFTGKEYDHRYPNYANDLKKYVRDHNLQEYVRFLGFIDRKEQLKLMDSALAIIQPSLFEGWSTVVEDAKALNQFIILSDIPLHREQIEQNVAFFEANDPVSLAENMKLQLTSGQSLEPIDYETQKMGVAHSILNVLTSLHNNNTDSFNSKT